METKASLTVMKAERNALAFSACIWLVLLIYYNITNYLFHCHFVRMCTYVDRKYPNLPHQRDFFIRPSPSGSIQIQL